ncbi:CHAT domain-containing protein [Candidatus Oscillochloris fontis]|uniref:CHAT domain-containing protein n=1 Tax=Candidatus Oscillochloris fontis TaxID=2496868 RepID=UPI00101BCD94|nr:CHAT domain-containing protein [Candidatus Oscillochloris fontis]
MIFLYDIVNEDFIRLKDDQQVSQVSELLQRITPARIIIVSQPIAPSNKVNYHVYTPKDLLSQLAKSSLELSLAEALNLSNQPTTPTLPAHTDAESAPPLCIIIEDDDQIIGFYDEALPRLSTNRYGSSIRDSVEADSSYMLTADSAEQVTFAQVIPLLVSIAHRFTPQSAIPIETLAGAEVDIVVSAKQGFMVEGPSVARYVVTNDAEPLPFQFKLRATSIGPGKIWIQCFHLGQPLGRLTLTPLVLPIAHGTDERPAEHKKALVSPVNSPPDLTLLVFERIEQGQIQIEFRLSAADPTLNLNLKLFHPATLLRLDPLRYFQLFFHDIEDLSRSAGGNPAVIAQRLERKGAMLFQELLPPDLQTLLWRLRDQIHSIYIQSDEPWIPWELLRLQGGDDGIISEGPYLCEAFAVTRWFPGIGQRPTLRLERMAVVVPQDSGLPYAQEERKHLLSLAQGIRTVVQVPANYLDILDVLSQGIYDGVHFTGHGVFAEADPNQSAIMLEKHARLSPDDIIGRVKNLGRASPLVFLNACQIGRQAMALTGIGGWAKRFAEAGAAAFVGSLWSVSDHAACEFSRVFYNHLLAGEPIGRATQQARAAIRSPGDPTWLAYTVFADPMAAVMEQNL